MDTETAYAFAGIGLLVCGVVSAKWASELGMSQGRQLVWGLGGVLLGPIALLLLYQRLAKHRRPNA